MEATSPQALLRAPLHAFGPQDWADWYPRVAELLDADDPADRAAAVERLAMAVFWAESASPPSDASDQRRQRLDWLTGLIDIAMTRHVDVLTCFLDQLRFKGDSPEFADGVLTWLRSLQQRQNLDLPQERIEGAMILIGGIAPWTGTILPPVLDHASDYVRACAACVLGRSGQGLDENENLADSGFFAALTEKELDRPGIAGPYWSGTDLMYEDQGEIGFDVVDWMLGIIERRRGPEPSNLPFNGIDFHIHELASEDPKSVRRLIAAGRLDLAVMTATDIRSRIETMFPGLSELADVDDPGIALQAQIHLAHYYGFLHPRANPDRIRHLEHWSETARAFVIRHGPTGTHSGQLVIFPKHESGFGRDEAMALIDQAIPPHLRGDLKRHFLDFGAQDAEPAPYQFGQDELHSYTSGANIELARSRDGQGWQRIDISAGRLGDRWDPWTW